LIDYWKPKRIIGIVSSAFVLAHAGAKNLNGKQPFGPTIVHDQPVTESASWELHEIAC
jgi:hypothetical protein